MNSDANPINLIEACREIRKQHALSHAHKCALAWIVGLLLAKEKQQST